MSFLQELDSSLAGLAARTQDSLVEVHNGRRGHGAGTIWHADGLIVTNAHVVDRGSVGVVLPDGRDLPATVIARDEACDLAALTVDAKGLRAIDLGDSRALRAGQWVMAIGHPWGVIGAATAGVVIGTGTAWPEGPGREAIAVSLHLRPGHSGGPLIDVEGRLVGINVMMQGPDVGVAIPVHVAKNFLRQSLRTS